MAFETPAFLVGVLPSNSNQLADNTTLSGQFLAVQIVPLGTDNTQAAWDIASSGTVIPQGILQNNPQQYEAAAVMIQGITKAVLGNTVTVGQLLMATTGGALIPWTSGNYQVGQALGAGASGDVISVLLKTPVKV